MLTGRWAFENLAAAVAVVDAHGRVLDANPALCDFLGRERGSLVGLPVGDLIAEGGRSLLGDDLDRTVLGTDRNTWGTRTLIERADGTAVWVLVTLKAIRPPAGEDPYLFAHFQDISSLHASEEQTRAALDRLRRTLDDIVDVVARMVEYRDPYTAGHQAQVAELAVAIATTLGLDADTIECVRVGATIHDVGKIAIPYEILTRPGPLSDAEFELVKAHPLTGRDIIAGVEFPGCVDRVVGEHHERLDGSGYPYGLTGDDIALESRIVAVADVVDATAAHRPYHSGLGLTYALDVIRSGRGTLFDPDVVDACLHCAPTVPRPDDAEPGTLAGLEHR